MRPTNLVIGCAVSMLALLGTAAAAQQITQIIDASGDGNHALSFPRGIALEADPARGLEIADVGPGAFRDLGPEAHLQSPDWAKFRASCPPLSSWARAQPGGPRRRLICRLPDSCPRPQLTVPRSLARMDSIRTEPVQESRPRRASRLQYHTPRRDPGVRRPDAWDERLAWGCWSLRRTRIRSDRRGSPQPSV